MSLPKKNRAVVPVDSTELTDITSEYVESDESPIVNHLCKLAVNGKCLFDDFLNEKPKKVGNKKKILEELDAYLTLLIEGEAIPPNKMKAIGSNEYELRIKRARIYFFYDHPNNNILVSGHYNKKNDNQQSYIDRFRELKTKYQNLTK